MKTMFDAAARQVLMERFARLSPDRKPLWGRMNCTQMLTHCADPMRAAMGELEVKSNGPWFLSLKLMRHAVIYWFPFPKGAPTAPEFMPPPGGDWAKAMEGLSAAAARFAAVGENGTLRPHPAFGDISTRDWGYLTWKHLDHHLRQFGA
ncbi:MAG: DUF1569 domain-containing protein [Bryobacteraceae bacterium]|nr:DUF1569 domain-containing protein [Bryobacteraceae bacterium]